MSSELRTALCLVACLATAPAMAAEYKDGPAVAVKYFEGSGPHDYLGKGLAELVMVDLAELANNSPEFADCHMAITEWMRRDEILKEIEFSQSKYVDPATRMDTSQLIDPNIFVDGSVSTTEDSVSWTIDVRSAESNTILRTDTGTVPANEAIYVSESIARRIADYLCGLQQPKPAQQPEPPTRRSYRGTVSASFSQPGMNVSASGQVYFREDAPDSGSFNSVMGWLNVQYQADDCSAFSGVLPLAGSLQLDAPDAGQHLLALMTESFEISCHGVRVPQDITGILATCAPGNGGAADRDLQGAGGCDNVNYRWQLSRR